MVVWYSHLYENLPQIVRKGSRTRDQIANICWIIEKAREFQKNIYLCFIDYVKAFDCVDHKKLENSEREGNTRPPDLLPDLHTDFSGGKSGGLVFPSLSDFSSFL